VWFLDWDILEIHRDCNFTMLLLVQRIIFIVMIIIVVKDTLKRKDSLFDGHTVVCYLGYLDSVCDGDYDYDDDDDGDDDDD